MTTPSTPSLPPGYVIRSLRSFDECLDCFALQQETWGQNFREAVPASLLHVVPRVGGITAGAFGPNGKLIGFVFGFTGIAAGEPVHWSDMLAVHPAERGRGIGQLLKRFQRDSLLAAGIHKVYWTFDPLEARNAFINFARLGILAVDYLPDFYGESDSPLHAGIGTDRLHAVWLLASKRVERRLSGESPPPGPQEVEDAQWINPPLAGGAGPACAAPDLALDSPRLRVAIPLALQELKSRDPELALDWRAKTRAAFSHYLRRGYSAAEVVREADCCAYVLERRALES